MAAVATAVVILVVLIAVCFVGATIFIVFVCHRRRTRRGEGGGGGGDVEQQTSAKVTDAPPPQSDSTPNNKQSTAILRFSWPEIQSLTANFDPNSVIGEGGFSTVYLARCRLQRAIKVHRFSERLHRAFRQELDALLRLRHPNIVTLLGYCDHHHEGGALVLQYVPGGTLQDRLHGGTGTGTGTHLSWPRRISIAYQLALAVHYLHDDCDPQVVHGDIKAANVLLDARADPKLCDFGSARMGFSAAVRSSAADKPTMTGSPGYVDPHYLRSGMVSKKSDVYSFGVLLLELVTGQEAFCVETERPLTAVLGPMLREGREGEVAVDGRLNGEYDAAEAAATVELGGRCVGDQPSLRPSMAEVVRVLAGGGGVETAFL